jgi:protein required for attachment to host cells
MMRPVKTWIVVADGSRARFLTFVFVKERVKATTIPEQVFFSPAPPTRALGRSKPPRSFESVRHISHGIEPRVDLHESLELDFLRGVAHRLQEAFERGDFQQFVLVAPPKALGRFRTILDRTLKSRMLIDIDADLTKHADEEIARLVVERLNDAGRKRGTKAIPA